MNRSTSQRSEEARRQAMVALDEAKQRQIAMIDERSKMFESETRKIQDLRAKRIARTVTTSMTDADIDLAAELVLKKVRSA
jgi:hypothetical protein